MLRYSKYNFWFAWFFLLTLIIISLSSCITQRRCNERYPPQTTDSTSTVTRDSIIIHHDTIYIESERVTIHDTIPCPTLEYHRTVTKNRVTASVDIHAGQLTVDCKADSLQRLVNTMEHRITTMTAHSDTKVVTVTNHEPRWYDMMGRWWMGISMLLLVLLLLFKRVFPFDAFRRNDR